MPRGLSVSRVLLICLLVTAVSPALSSCGEGVAPAASSIVTTTTDSVAELELRVEQWIGLLESGGDTTGDMTSELAAFLWPKDEAADRAAELQNMHRAEPASTNPILENVPLGIVRTTLSEGGRAATVLYEGRLMWRDGLTTRFLQVLTWTQQDGQWYRTTSFEPLQTKLGGTRYIDASISVDGLTWSPMQVAELRHLSVEGNRSGGSGMYLDMRMRVLNVGDVATSPGDYLVVLWDKDGHQFVGSSADSEPVLNPVWSRELSYTFEVPEGLDLEGLQYEIRYPRNPIG